MGAIEAFPQYRDRLHILRRPINPALLDRFITRRFRRAGLEVIPKRGSLDHLLACLQRGDAVVFIMDQHAGGRDGVLVDFFGHPAWTFRSLAVIALSTGAPVVPATAWREADGTHVLSFGEALSTIDHVKPGEAIRANTQLYNRALERIIRRHPEQWIWMHRRWKDA